MKGAPRRWCWRWFLVGSLIVVTLTACGAGSGAAVPGCGEGDPVADRPLRVATTVAPITSIVANIAGGTATVVTGLVPEGTNSHTYEPEPSVVASLENADIVFVNGLVLEEPTKELAAANLAGGAEICELGTTILPEDEYIYDFSFPEDGGTPNPHLWTNPPMAAEYAALIRDVLVARDPANADRFRANHDAFAARIDEFDAALHTATATIPAARRLLLTYHDAYAYFAREYDWTVVGAIQPSSFDEPSARDVAALVGQVEELDVPAVFGSEVFPSPVLERIAAESGASYVDDLRDDDLPGAPGDAEHSWLALMRFDYVTIVEALGGDATALRALDATDVAPDEATYPQ
ncbi:MAG: zinc ABC transporter substrate-binding protein [Acidimicrobiia bacterium]|nr:zinc ABC transporter substrate-binding protein [Acidimicrobiia bacterium]